MKITKILQEQINPFSKSEAENLKYLFKDLKHRTVRAAKCSLHCLLKFNPKQCIISGPRGSVGIATGYRLDGPGIESR
jgi:hypothetical protein